MRIELETPPVGDLPVDIRSLRLPDLFSLSPREIKKLTVLVAGHLTQVGECLRLLYSSKEADELILSGATGRIVAAGCRMDSGRLVIRGDAGSLTGMEMSGGELEIQGNAGDCLGAAMHGGLLKVHGWAGNWCGAAMPGQSKGMSGGTILVDGDVGTEAGAGMRRGLLVIGGNCGELTAAGMLAGTIFCLGHMGKNAGLEMKRGSLVATSSDSLLPGFLPAGEADSEWLRIYQAWLSSLGWVCPPAWEDHLPWRFTGDHLVTGKGEVLIYEIFK